MITATIFRNADNEIYGFDIDNHGDKIVCAAVSILTLNTVNCIKHFTNEKFTCDYDQSGGRLSVNIPTGKHEHVSHDAQLLIDAMVFGLYGIKDQYGKSLNIIEHRLGRDLQ